MADYREFEHLLLGQWHDVLSMYGIEIPQMKGKNSVNYPCPLCPDGGHDRAHWRDEDGRLSLYCRKCSYERMKSPEEVIMEACNISFSDLVNDLYNFIGGMTNKEIDQATKISKSKPKINLPKDDKRDHAGCVDMINGMSECGYHYILNRYSVQHPDTFYKNESFIAFPIVNESGVIVNAFMIRDLGGGVESKFYAGGPSYSAWHKIEPCDIRKTGRVAWSVSLISGIRHWFLTGDEIRVLFDYNCILFAANIGLIKKNDALVLTDEQISELPEILN